MKIGLPSQSKQKIGGGWSFVDNLTKGLLKQNIQVVNDEDADIVLIAGATLLERDRFHYLKSKGKKIVLRLDNILRHSRNRGSGMPRMKEFAKKADAVIYQSRWAKDLLGDYLGRDGVIIHNSVDENIFNKEGAFLDFRSKGEPIYLYSRYSRDELKRWEKCYYEYIKIQKENPKAYLVLVGRFSDTLRQYNFDFFNNERYEYVGIMNTAEMMARLYRGVDYLMATYYNDCFSNTYIEALMCGCDLYKLDMTGGTPEIVAEWEAHGSEYFSLKRMTDEYIKLFNSL